MSVGLSPSLIIHRPAAVEKTKKTKVSRKTYRNGRGPFRGSRPRNFAKTNPPFTSYMYAVKEGTRLKNPK
jgi:hypothetical protein